MLFRSNALPEAVVSVLIVAAWVLGGGVPARTALIGFASPTWLMLVLIFAIGSVIAATGVIYRLALWAAVKLRAGFIGQVLSLGTVGLLSGPALPSPPGRLHIVAPALEELSAAFGYAPHSRAAIGLAMATLTGFGLMVWPFMTSSSTALLLYTTLPAASREGLSWSTWALRAAPLTLVLFGGLLLLICFAYRPGRQGDAGDAKRRSDSVLALQREIGRAHV